MVKTNSTKLSTEEEQRRYAFWTEGMTDTEIAEKCEVSPNCISQWRRCRGLVANKKATKTDFESRRISGAERMYLDLDVSPIPEDAENTVEYVIETVRCVDDRSREMLKKRYMDNLTLDCIGKQYGLCRERIRSICKKELEEIKQSEPEKMIIFKYGLAAYNEAMGIHLDMHEEKVKKVLGELEQCEKKTSVYRAVKNERIRRKLVRNGIYDLVQLSGYGRIEMQEQFGIGYAHYIELRDILQENGINYKKRQKHIDK